MLWKTIFINCKLRKAVKIPRAMSPTNWINTNEVIVSIVGSFWIPKVNELSHNPRNKLPLINTTYGPVEFRTISATPEIAANINR